MEISRLRAGYNVEVRSLAAVSRSPDYKVIIRNYRDYQKFQKERLCNIDSKKLIETLSQGNGKIDLEHTDSLLRRVFAYAQVAACCALFPKVPLKSGAMESKDVNELLESTVGDAVFDLAGQMAKELGDRLHQSDALRMMEILRQLGLLRQSPDALRQVSFGAGPGNKDIETIHSVPVTKLLQGKLFVDTVYRQPEHVILIDNDEGLEQHYRNLNDGHGGRVLAIMKDAEAAVEQILKQSAEQQVEKRNFVVGIRVDHGMIPSVPDFFAMMLPLLDERAELLVSVGAGHTLDEFTGRIALMQRIHDFLRACGLNPLHLKLHGGVDEEQQRNSPAFGLTAYTTYEIIHCVLERKKLACQ